MDISIKVQNVFKHDDTWKCFVFTFILFTFHASSLASFAVRWMKVNNHFTLANWEAFLKVSSKAWEKRNNLLCFSIEIFNENTARGYIFCYFTDINARLVLEKSLIKAGKLSNGKQNVFLKSFLEALLYAFRSFCNMRLCRRVSHLCSTFHLDVCLKTMLEDLWCKVEQSDQTA